MLAGHHLHCATVEKTVTLTCGGEGVALYEVASGDRRLKFYEIRDNLRQGKVKLCRYHRVAYAPGTPGPLSSTLATSQRPTIFRW